MLDMHYTGGEKQIEPIRLRTVEIEYDNRRYQKLKREIYDDHEVLHVLERIF